MKRCQIFLMHSLHLLKWLHGFCLLFNYLDGVLHNLILQRLNHHPIFPEYVCVYNKNIWSWCIILFICSWIPCANILLRIFASIFMRIFISSFFFFFLFSLSGFSISVTLASENELGDISTFSILGKNLGNIDINSLNVR